MNDPTRTRGPTAPQDETAPVQLYTTRSCGYCLAAKRLLGRLGIAFIETDISNDPALRRRLSLDNDGYRTVPMIYLAGRFIGGYDELVALERAGRLAHLRAAV